MARYTGPVCRLCRRAQMKLFLKGDKCLTDRCPVEKRPYPPGEHGRRRRKESEYYVMLREKQKARQIYGVLEKQFRIYYDVASRQKGITGENLLRILETRLDNVVYRMGLAFSRPEARQLVRHGHFEVNGHRVDIPSYQVSVGDVIKAKSDTVRIKEAAESSTKAEVPGWIDVDHEARVGKVLRMPARDDIDEPVKETLVVEYYSK